MTAPRFPLSLADRIDRLAAKRPAEPAFLGEDGPVDWADYKARSDGLARLLVGLGLAVGERVGVLLPDGPGVHAAFIAAEKAGLVAVGIGPRAGVREIEHLLKTTGACALLSRAHHRGEDMRASFGSLQGAGAPLRHHIVVDSELETAAPVRVDGVERSLPQPDPTLDAALAKRRLRADALFLLNSTSGTTGLPKVVKHDQLRWLAFHEFAVASGDLSSDDVILSVVPAPFGFGIWTSHVTPVVLGAPLVVSARFSAEATLELIERYRVSVLAAVSTQFILLLECPDSRTRDLSSLRALYTGGEAVPYARAAEFEDRTGARVLQFYGSNETGAVSGTRLDDSREQRFATAGRVLPEMNVRLFDGAGNDVTDTGRGQPGCKGPTLSGGYWENDEANAALIRADGWMMLGDEAEIDSDGYLRVVGRTDDFIIRGGKNISGPGVEEQVATHPAVTLAAAVAMPDKIFGERVCVYVELRDGASLTLEELVLYLRAGGTSVEMLPEKLVVVDALPRGSGGKIAKQELREDIVRRVAEGLD